MQPWPENWFLLCDYVNVSQNRNNNVFGLKNETMNFGKPQIKKVSSWTKF